jgi:hypothetical protein
VWGFDAADGGAWCAAAVPATPPPELPVFDGHRSTTAWDWDAAFDEFEAARERWAKRHSIAVDDLPDYRIDGDQPCDDEYMIGQPTAVWNPQSQRENWGSRIGSSQELLDLVGSRRLCSVYLLLWPLAVAADAGLMLPAAARVEVLALPTAAATFGVAAFSVATDKVTVVAARLCADTAADVRAVLVTCAVTAEALVAGMKNLLEM